MGLYISENLTPVPKGIVGIICPLCSNRPAHNQAALRRTVLCHNFYIYGGMLVWCAISLMHYCIPITRFNGIKTDHSHFETGCSGQNFCVSIVLCGHRYDITISFINEQLDYCTKTYACVVMVLLLF